MPGDKNYWGTEEEWERMDRRVEGREGRKYRERRGLRSKDTIAREVAGRTKITVEDLKSLKRGKKLSRIRQEAMGQMYEEGYSPTQIGKYFNRPPQAVLYAKNKTGRIE
ncbi:MAG: helix-turn-helix domain-containing protein [bacterium]